MSISRKGSIVKERCRQLTEIALELFPNRRITHQDLAYLIMSYIGGDKITVRAYMGYNGFVKHKSMGGSVVIGQKHKGYLEIFGFMHRGKYRTWIIHVQTTLNTA